MNIKYEIEKVKLQISLLRLKRKQAQVARRLKASLINAYDFHRDGYLLAIDEMRESIEIEMEGEIEKRFLAMRESHLLESASKTAPNLEELLTLKDKLHDRYLETERLQLKNIDVKQKLTAISAQRELIDKLIERKVNEI